MNNNVIKMALWNARGVRFKKDELFQFININKIDICLLCETGLNKKYSIKHNNFYCYRYDRPQGRGGGVAILVRKNIPHHLLPLKNTKVIEHIGIKISTINGSLNLYACYFPGGAGGDTNRKQSFISDIRMLTNPNDSFILAGDFNCRNRYWGCQTNNSWGNILYERLKPNELEIVYPHECTHIPTDPRRRPSTLDFFLTNNPHIISSIRVINDLSSDHLPVIGIIKKSFHKIENKMYNYSKANWSKFAKHINRNLPLSPNFTEISNKSQIDEMISSLNNTIKGAIECSVPKRREFVNNKPLPNNIKVLIQFRNIYRRNWKRYKDANDHQQMTRLNKQITDELLKHRHNSWNNMLSTLDKSSSPFWKISKILNKKHKNIPILKDNTSTYCTLEEKCNVLANTFELNNQVSNHLSDDTTISEVNNVVNSIKQTEITHIDQNFYISFENTSSFIKALKNKKSPGIDKINNKCLKNLPKKGIKYITNLFNSCLKLYYFPNQWKKSKTIAIPKPNKPAESPNSYRPISLLPSISKILEKIIKEKILDFVETNEIFPSQQFGFRKQHNTAQPLLKIRKLVRNEFVNGRSTGMVLLDIKSAFDSVWHNGLIFKLKRFNFPIEIIKIVLSFLSERSFNVCIGETKSREVNINAGCPQGSCLSPVLYNIYTADIPSFSGCITSIFADDTSILSSDIYSVNIINNLESALTELNDYFAKWKILINPDKTKAIYFTRKRKSCFTPQQPLHFINHNIPWEESVKYLGVVLDTKLNFKTHIPYIVDKINKVTRILYPLINRKSDLSIDNKKLIIKAIFHPIMFYCTPVWSTSANCHTKKLQVAQNKLLKMIFRLPWHYSTQRLHTLAGFPTVNVKLTYLTENFVRRCQSSQYDHINELIST